MKRKAEKDYLDKEWETMRSHLRAFYKNGEQEDIHRLRVQVKKLSAFMVLADSDRDNPELEKCFKPVKKLFKEAGEIRDPFMNLEMAKTNEVTDEDFIVEQEHKMKAATKKFKANSHKRLEKLKEVKLELKKLIDPISDVHINIYYEQQLKQIAGGLSDNKFGYELHNCRTKIKMLIYNYELVKPVLTLGFNEDYMEDMQTAIGDWHDNWLTINLLTDHNTIHKNIIRNFDKRDKELERNISKLIPDFYDRATTVMELPVEQID